MSIRRCDPHAQAEKALQRVRAAGRPLRWFLGFRAEGKGVHVLRLSEEVGRVLVHSLPRAELTIAPDEPVDDLAARLTAIGAELVAAYAQHTATGKPRASHGWRRTSRTPA